MIMLSELQCLETLLHCTYLVTWTSDLTDKASWHQTSVTVHLAEGGGRGGGGVLAKIDHSNCGGVHAPHLSHEEAVRHLPPKHLHKIALPQLQLKLWVGTRGALLRIIVVQSNKLRE